MGPGGHPPPRIVPTEEDPSGTQPFLFGPLVLAHFPTEDSSSPFSWFSLDAEEGERRRAVGYSKRSHFFLSLPPPVASPCYSQVLPITLSN